MTIFAGTILPYGGSSVPTGYLLCDGSAVSRTTYATLFGVIGTTYGAGDGSTTFNVPDLRGRSVAQPTTIVEYIIATADEAATMKTIQAQVFSSGGTYTPNSNLLYAIAMGVGGGGGGGGGNGSPAAGGGGGGGGFALAVLSKATIGASQTVTIGAAGTAGSTSSSGGGGGTTSLGSLLVAPGGSGGGGGAGNLPFAGGAGGVGSTGTVKSSGGSGVNGCAFGSIIVGGTGGGSFFGGGGHGGINGVGTAAQNYGGGGGGGGGNNAGAAGTAGYLAILEFCSA